MGFTARHCERCRRRSTISILRAKASSFAFDACEAILLDLGSDQGRDGLLIHWSSKGNAVRLRYLLILAERKLGEVGSKNHIRTNVTINCLT